MTQSQKGFRSAVILLIGSIIGVGMFSVPYAFSRVGLVPALAYLFGIAALQLLQHLFYTETAIACPDKLRLVGLVERYIGKRAKAVAATAVILGYWGAILAYMVVGGTFLHALLSPYLGGALQTYQIGWALCIAFVVYFGMSFITRVSIVATSALFVAMLAIFTVGIPHVQPAHYLPLWSGHDLLLPYGILLFSLSGLPAILEMEDILKGKHVYYRRAVITGSLVAAALIGTFGFVVWGVTGPDTTHSAVDGLRVAIGPGIAVLGSLIGFLAVVTACFASSLNLQNTFRFDYRLPRVPAWLLTVGPSFALMLLGAKDFVSIVGFSGAVFSGISAIMVSLLYIKVTKANAVAKRKRLGVPVWAAYVSIVLLASGALLTVGHAVEGLFR